MTKHATLPLARCHSPSGGVSGRQPITSLPQPPTLLPQRPPHALQQPQQPHPQQQQTFSQQPQPPLPPTQQQQPQPPSPSCSSASLSTSYTWSASALTLSSSSASSSTDLIDRASTPPRHGPRLSPVGPADAPQSVLRVASSVPCAGVSAACAGDAPHQCHGPGSSGSNTSTSGSNSAASNGGSVTTLIHEHVPHCRQYFNWWVRVNAAYRVVTHVARLCLWHCVAARPGWEQLAKRGTVSI